MIFFFCLCFLVNISITFVDINESKYLVKISNVTPKSIQMEFYIHFPTLNHSIHGDCIFQTTKTTKNKKRLYQDLAFNIIQFSIKLFTHFVFPKYS